MTLLPLLCCIALISRPARAFADATPPFDIGAFNIPGVDWQRPGKVNQDAHFVRQLHVDGDDGKSDYTLLGVLDGHGKAGHDVSSFAAANLPREIHAQLSAQDPVLAQDVADFETRAIQRLGGFKSLHEYKSACTLEQRCLVNAFHTVHYNAMVDESVRAGRSGTTCVACLIDNASRECAVAYVGDSRAICFGPDCAVSTIAPELTVNVPSERERIDAGEGSIRGTNVFYGPVGIAMTRALGDAVMVRAGVVPTPAADAFCLEDGDTLVLATDGVWDVLSNEVVRDIVATHGIARECAEAVARAARERWVGDLPILDEEKADDITVMVLKC